MTDTIYNHSVDMLRQRMPELNYRSLILLILCRQQMVKIKNYIFEIFVYYNNFYSIFVMCANEDSIRDIMLGAEEIGILDTGQYVFINMGKTFYFHFLNLTKLLNKHIFEYC